MGESSIVPIASRQFQYLTLPKICRIIFIYQNAAIITFQQTRKTEINNPKKVFWALYQLHRQIVNI